MGPKSDLFSAKPAVFTIPASTGFIKALAEGLVVQFPDYGALSQVTVLLPTRRAGRALAQAFTQIEGRPKAALLPLIRPLGDIDSDDPPFEPGELAHIAPDAISFGRRRFELARLIYEKEYALKRPISTGEALSLAGPLAQLLDDLANEDVEDLSGLEADIGAHLPAHMSEAAMFLDIILEAWPARLAELGYLDPAKRRSLILNALSERWQSQPPDAEVIAAGSVGSIPAVARLLNTIAHMPKGCVVLPGFQPDMDERAWVSLDDGHPQRAMKTLVETFKIDRKHVRVWPGCEEGRKAAQRTRLIAEALRPAEATSDWLARISALKSAWGEDMVEDALEGLSILEVPTPADEARVIALALKKSLSIPETTAILVTPDRSLARRVSVEMHRFGVTLDNSAGIPLSDTAVGGFLMRILQAALDPGSALALTSLMASPLVCMGENRALLRADFGQMERDVLRGLRPGQTFSALLQRLQDKTGEDHGLAARWYSILERFIGSMASFVRLHDAQSAKSWAVALVEAGESLCADAERDGAQRLWAGDNGEAAAALVREFIEESEALPDLSLYDFTQAFLEAARSRLVRPSYGAHPRLQVLGPLEARLVTADQVILSGLNEGVWPTGHKSDPFLSRGMRKAAGLTPPELRFGLAAHDFAQLAAAPNVVITRSQKQDGAPSLASRWVWRLQTLAQGASRKADALLAPETDYLALSKALDKPSRRNLISQPFPKPPAYARPRQLSVTQIETWIRDPYAIFAKKILNLDPLEGLDCPAGPKERGTAYHSALERWARILPDGEILPDEAFERLIDIGRQCLLEAGFAEYQLGLEWPRFIRVAAFVTEWEAERRMLGFSTIAIEALGAMAINVPKGPFMLTGRADRIDLRPDGALDIIDFKTGAVPGKKEVHAGFAPQLPLEAIMAARGKFDDVPSHETGDLIYLRINGGRIPGFERSVINETGSGEAIDLAEDALDDLASWIIAFDNEDQAYLSQPRTKHVNQWGAFDHLARRKEWASAAEPGEGGE